jgi:hydrogenase expression/formation protein HypE
MTTLLKPAISCPAPVSERRTILLGHGSGGRLSAELLHDLFLPAFSNVTLARLDDQAVLPVGNARIAFTTDSFVVRPLFFPGGDIGSLAINGTVNDLAMAGARPLWLSVAFILEEGFPLDDLRRIIGSARAAAEAAGVEIVTGDTKVVERGAADGLFINTSGIGLVPESLELSCDRARPGDRVLLSGGLGEHGIAVLAARDGLGLTTTITSDCAALHTLVQTMLATASGIRCMRDPTRGGLASALNEIAAQSSVAIELEEAAIPIDEQVRGACELLGLDPHYVANEGKLVAIVAREAAEPVLASMRRHPLGRQAQIIGAVADAPGGLVTLRTTLGTCRTVDMLAGDQLPRIC